MKLRFFITLVLLMVSGPSQASNLTPDGKTRSDFINHVIRLVNNNYLYPQKARQINQNLKNKLANGHFDQFHSKADFADALTQQLQAINGDLHLNVSVLADEPGDALSGLFNKLLDGQQRNRDQFNGFNAVQNLGHGVGYLSLSYFRTAAIELADHYMKLLEHSDAIIIDLRDNKGGTTQMVNYLSAYFFDKPLHASDTIGRDGKKRAHWLDTKVNGLNRPDVPLFILVNNVSASGAEGFSFLMQNQKRATIIGETTIGAAHSGAAWYLDGFRVFIPNEAHVDPISGKNWEASGVIPDIKTTDRKSYEQALTLAIEAAKRYRESNRKTVQAQFDQLRALLKNPSIKNVAKQVHQTISALTDKKLLTEDSINSLGYAYVELKNNQGAELVFKSNTLLFPNSANAFDSYAESLEMNGHLKRSLNNYQQAVALAKKHHSGNLKYHLKAAERVKAKLVKNSNNK